MKVHVENGEIARLLRAEGMGWGGSGNTLFMSDPPRSLRRSMAGIGSAILRLAAGAATALTRKTTAKEATHGTA